jgi:hypothetical protein
MKDGLIGMMKIELRGMTGRVLMGMTKDGLIGMIKMN